jgi:hypothetical protein
MSKNQKTNVQDDFRLWSAIACALAYLLPWNVLHVTLCVAYHALSLEIATGQRLLDLNAPTRAIHSVDCPRKGDPTDSRMKSHSMT